MTSSSDDAEAAFYDRCLARDPESALRLLTFRRYADAAVISGDLPDLATDRAAVLDTSTFTEAWQEPGRIPWMLDALQHWRHDFIFVYHARHTAHAPACHIDAELLAEALEHEPACPSCGYVLVQQEERAADNVGTLQGGA